MKNVQQQIAENQSARQAQADEREQGGSGPWGMLPAEEVAANQEARYEAGQ